MSIPVQSPQLSAKANLVLVDGRLNQAAIFRTDCKMLILEAQKACKDMQDLAKNRLYERVEDIKFVKRELEMVLKELTLEINGLIALQSRVKKALEGTKEPLRVSMLCQEERMKRFPSERLHDAVDVELVKEREIIEGAASLLQSVVEQITEQIRLNRSAKYHLEQDLKEKFEAQCIDKSCSIMTVHSIANPPDVMDTTLLSTSVTPKQWEHISDVNIGKANQENTNSMTLRALVESVLEQTAADMKKQLQATKTAFQMNIQELKSAKSQMEEGIPKILFEISGQQRMSEDLQVSILQTEATLSLAQSQLALRSQRPGKEKCHDLVQVQLLTEVQQLAAHISRLYEEISSSESEQRALVRCQLKLQNNIDMKAKSLYIDEVICSQHREPIVIYKF